MQVHDIDFVPARESPWIAARVTAAVTLRLRGTFSTYANHLDG